MKVKDLKKLLENIDSSADVFVSVPEFAVDGMDVKKVFVEKTIGKKTDREDAVVCVSVTIVSEK